MLITNASLLRRPDEVPGSNVTDDIVELLKKSAVAALEARNFKEQIAATGPERFDLWADKQTHGYYMREVAQYRAIANSINLQPHQ